LLSVGPSTPKGSISPFSFVLSTQTAFQASSPVAS